MFKVNDRNTRTSCEIFSKLTIKTSQRRHWRRSGVFIVNFENIPHLVLVFLLFILNMQFPAGHILQSNKHALISISFSNNTLISFQSFRGKKGMLLLEFNCKLMVEFLKNFRGASWSPVCIERFKKYWSRGLLHGHLVAMVAKFLYPYFINF